MIKEILKKALSNQLISGGGLLFVGTFLGSILNFLFNVFMSRNLSVSDYGTLATLLSLTTSSALLASAFIPTIVTFTAGHFAKGEREKVRSIFFELGRVMFSIAILIFIFFFIARENLAEFLQIKNSSLIILTGVTIALGEASILNQAILQSSLRFGYISLINFLNAFLKLTLGFVLIRYGLGVLGALWAVIVGYLIPFLISFLPIKFVFNKSEGSTKAPTKDILKYGLPAAATTFGLIGLISLDLVLVKHFFSPEESGLYAGLTLVGKVIYFLTLPVGIAMFPIIVQKRAKSEDYIKTFILAFFLVLIPSVAITAFYSLFPEFSITFFLKNPSYLLISPYLWLFAVFMTLYAILSLTVNFFLSIKKTFVSVPVVSGLLLQGVLIWVFHDNFFQIIFISILVSSLLLFWLLLYYLKISFNGEKL